MTIVILNRLTGPLANFHDWVPRGVDVCFLYNSEGRVPLSSLPSSWSHHYVSNFDDIPNLKNVIRGSIGNKSLSAIVATSENVLRSAGILRDCFDQKTPSALARGKETRSFRAE